MSVDELSVDDLSVDDPSVRRVGVLLRVNGVADFDASHASNRFYIETTKKHVTTPAWGAYVVTSAFYKFTHSRRIRWAHYYVIPGAWYYSSSIPGRYVPSDTIELSY